MKVNMSIKRKFKINGKEYGSLEEMPPDVRAIFEKAASGSVIAGREMTTTMTSKIVFNGAEYRSAYEMPSDARNLYEQTMKAAGTENTLQATARATFERLPESASHDIKTESSFSARSVGVLVLIIGLLLIAYYLFR